MRIIRGDGDLVFQEINIGVAVALEEGLIVPVDLRVLDGVVAARFLQDLRGAIEEPGWLSY